MTSLSTEKEDIAGVEDVDIDLNALDRHLRVLGYHLVRFPTFEEGLDGIVTHDYEMAFIDIGLHDPNRGGIELVTEILKRMPYFYPIFLSKYDKEPAEKRIREAGIVSYSFVAKEDVTTDEKFAAHVGPVLRWKANLRVAVEKFKRHWGHLEQVARTYNPHETPSLRRAIWQGIREEINPLTPSAIGTAPPADLLNDVRSKLEQLAVAPNLFQVRDFPKVRDMFLNSLLPVVPENSRHARLISATGIGIAMISRLDFKGQQGGERFQKLLDLLKDILSALELPDLPLPRIRSLEYRLQEAGAELGLGYSSDKLRNLKKELNENVYVEDESF